MFETLALSKPEVSAATSVVDCLKAATASQGNPIDTFYGRGSMLLQRALQADADGEAELMPLLFLRLISATESYFRHLLCELPVICPLVRQHVASVTVPLGAVLYYQADSLAKAAFDHSSLCSTGELSKQTKKMSSFVCESDQSLREAIKLFEKVSQLRHAVVHAFDELNYQNVSELLGKADHGQLTVSISTIKFQEFVGVCYSVIRSYNRAISIWMIQQWSIHNVLSWNWSQDRVIFERFLLTFVSTLDGHETRTPKLVHDQLNAERLAVRP